MTTSIEQTHHIEIDTDPASLDRYRARCATHGTQALSGGYTPGDACARFTCDPADQRFVISHDGGHPRVTDLGGLRHDVRADIEASHYSDTEPLQYYRWTGQAPHLEPLTITLVDASSYDEDDYAHPRYTVTTPDGEAITEITCRIDGRA